MSASVAFYAGHAKRWKEAGQQFRLLGDDPPRLGLFDTLELHRGAKEEAARKAKALDF